MTDTADVILEPWELLEEMIDSGNAEALSTFLQLLAPEDTTYTISRLSEDRQTRMLSMLASVNADFAADLMNHFSDEQAADMIEELEPVAAAAIVEEMDSDEKADLLSELDHEDAEAILVRMTPEEADEARALLKYGEDTAGGLMITEYLAYRDDQDVDDVIHDLRRHAEAYRGFESRYLYVVDHERHLVGVVRMRDLVLASQGMLLTDLMIRNPGLVRVDDSLDRLEDQFDRVNYSTIPVLDAQGRLVGVVQRAAVQEALSERSSETLLKLSGIIGGEELRSMPTLLRAMRRLAFLLPIMCLTLVSASIIAIFEPTVGKLPILAAFLPVVSGLCGSGGNQAVGVSMREMSLGLIKPADFFAVVMKEAAVGFVNGLTLGLILMVVIGLWRDNFLLGAVVGTAMPLMSILAVSVGGVAPLMLRLLKVDPAMLSSPVMSTTVDTCSFFTILSLATILLYFVPGL
jgi:magnesium transporter